MKKSAKKAAPDASTMPAVPDAAATGAPEGRGPRVSAIDRALQVLDYLYELGAPAGAYAIARAIGAPLSTVYAIVENLAARGMLSRRSDGSVWLGVRLYHYGMVYARSLDFLSVATREMQDLCRETGETVQICSRDGEHMIVLATASGLGHFRISSDVGTRVPLNWTASGRLLVGHLPEAERLEVFRRCTRASPTGRALTSPAELSEAAGVAFASKLSVQVSESDFSVACVAAPICDGQGVCIATISMVLPEHKVSNGHGGYSVAVKAAAERIEKALGFQSVTTTMASTSTVMLSGNELKPTAERE
jgi:DNA-binding IclR family transcriptional regulator